MASSTAGAVVLWVSIIASGLLNVFFIGVFLLRKRMRTSETLTVNIVLMCMAVMDLAASVLWTLQAAVLASIGKTLPTESNIVYKILCQEQGFSMELYRLLNAYIFVLLAFEQFLRVFKPSKHREVFNVINICLILVGILIFAGYIAIQPVRGWGEIEFMSNQYQCAINYEKSTTHFLCSLILGYWLPIVLIAGFYISIAVMVIKLRKSSSPGAPIVLETNNHLRNESYSDRLQYQHATLEGIAMKGTQPHPKIQAQQRKKHKEEEESKANKANDASDGHANLSDADVNKVLTSWFDSFKLEVKDTAKADRNKKWKDLKRQYIFSGEDLSTGICFAVVSALFFILWLLYVVWSLRWTYIINDQFANNDNVVLAAVCLSHFSTCCKTPAYLISMKFRSAVMKTVGFGTK